MEFSALPLLVRENIFSFLTIGDLMSAADVSRQWRSDTTRKAFVEKYCRRRYLFSVRWLPREILPCEELLINTQRLMFNGTDPTLVEPHPALMKIYALELRSAWWPFALTESLVKQNVELADLKYPWPL